MAHKVVQDAIHYCDYLLKSRHHNEYKKQRLHPSIVFQDLPISNPNLNIWKATNDLTNKNAPANSSLPKDISANIQLSTIADKVRSVNKIE